MAVSSSVLVLFDLSALVASKTREWQEAARVGSCFVPDAVLAEIQFLCNRAPEPDLEQVAREFSRFYPTSGWQSTDASLTHPALQLANGGALSKKARLSLAVAECAYGLAQAHPEQLVVLVANDQPLLQKLPELQAANLCGITLVALLQWSRTQQQPPAVVQQLRSLKASSPLPERPAPVQASLPRPAAPTVVAGGGPASAVFRPQVRKPSFLPQLISGLIALSAAAIAGLVAWRMIQPASFNQFWKQTGLPALPGQSPARK